MVLKKSRLSRVGLASGIAFILFSLLTSAAWAIPHDPPLPSYAHMICTGAPILPGWVIVDRKTVLDDCQPARGGQGGINNMEAIAPPPTTTTAVCSNSPVPDGWVVTGDLGIDRQRCGLDVPNEKTIAPARGSQMQICASSPIPKGWVTVGEEDRLTRLSALFQCSAVGLLQLVQKTIVPADKVLMPVCQSSPIPKGYLLRDPAIYVKTCLAGSGKLIAGSLTSR